ncbi:MAG TPA: hypothetical protein DCR70_02055 [Phycisphaerales bacterium]|nr:hypothetical protein [Phycisphaerales bacterium]
MAAVIGHGADTPAAAREAVRELAPTAALQLHFLVLLCYRLHQTSPDAELGTTRDRYARHDAPALEWLHVFAPLFVQRGVALSGLPEALRERQLLAATCRPAARPTHLDSPSGGLARDAAWLLLSTTQLTVLPPLLSTTPQLLSTTPPLLGDGGLHVSWRLALLPMYAWLLLELALTASICCGGADRSLPANAHPADKLRAWWRQSRRGLWLVTLTALLLLFTWGGGALEAIRSGRRLAIELLGPLLVLGALALSCVGCLCGTLRRQRPRSRQSAGGGGGGGLGGGAGGTSFFGVGGRGTRFAFIVDKSGSMVNGRIGEAKQELYKAIVALPDFASVYVVFYDSSEPWAFSDRWERVRSSMVKKLKTWLNNVGPSGGTEPTPAFRAVFALDARPDVIFFLSDGEIPPESIAQIRQMNARGKRVTINAIAFGEESGSQQLRQIAQEADGEFRQVRPKGGNGDNPP